MTNCVISNTKFVIMTDNVSQKQDGQRGFLFSLACFIEQTKARQEIETNQC